MKAIYTLLLITIVFIFNACKSSEDPVTPPDPVGTLKVRGVVLLNGAPVQGALVAIDAVVNWRSSTGSDGTFEINGVSAGTHQISARKEFDEGKLAFQSASIVIQNPENDIGSLDLPSPITMQPISSPQENSIPLSWERISGNNFMEYKLYRSDSPGLDETNGELIFSTSNIDETSYTDVGFRTGRTYYYRVFAYVESGRYTGTNIVSTSVPEVNLVVNSDFEQSVTGVLPDYWQQMLSGSPEFDYFDVSSENVKNGGFSLKITYIDSLANPAPGFNPWGGLVQTLSTANLIAGEDYTLSFWSRSEIGNMQVRLLKNGDFEQPLVSYIIPNDQEWTEHQVNFRIDAETSSLELWINTRSGFAANGLVKGWVDNVKIIR